MIRILSIILLFSLNTGITLSQTITCNLTGTIINRNSDTLLVLPETEDPLRHEAIRIPIRNNTFTVTLEVPEIMCYNLIFQDELERGAWRRIDFFPEEGTTHFILYDTESSLRNTVSGGHLNAMMNAYVRMIDSLFTPMRLPYTRQLDSLWNNDEYFSDTVRVINAMLRITTDDQERSRLFILRDKLEREGRYFSPEAEYLTYILDSIGRISMYWMEDYIRDHIDLFSYSLIYQSLKSYNPNRKTTDIPFLTEICKVFSARFPDHPYTLKCGEMLNAINKVRTGNHFIDFEAPTLDGTMVRISDSIRGKFALIDLWASWCGSCRGLSKSMIPVYRKYHDKGFTIIGIACEYRNTDNLKRALAQDQYPWLNLVELNNSNGIWNKYNISGSGGNTYLVNPEGIIIAIRPDAKELERLLKELLP